MLSDEFVYDNNLSVGSANMTYAVYKILFPFMFNIRPTKSHKSLDLVSYNCLVVGPLRNKLSRNPVLFRSVKS